MFVLLGGGMRICLRRAWLVPIFYNLALFLKKFTIGPLENLNAEMDPGGRRHKSWRRGITSRRHGSRRRGPGFGQHIF